jgi:hypothetical protein
MGVNQRHPRYPSRLEIERTMYAATLLLTSLLLIRRLFWG